MSGEPPGRRPPPPSISLDRCVDTPPSQVLRQHSAPPGAIREGVTPAAPILSHRRPRHGPSAVSPAFGGKTFSLFPRPAFTVRGRSGPPAMGGSLWGRTPGVPQARPGVSFTHRKRAPPQLWPDSFYSAVCLRSPLPRRERAFSVPSPVTGPSTAWTGAGGRGRCLGPARRHLLSPSG